MVKRNPVSTLQNTWFDSEQVDDTDLATEQNYNNSTEASIISNHIGEGVLKDALNQNILFDSSLISTLLDGTNVSPQAQPSDNNFGNQLEIELSQSKAAGKRAVKVAIIGLDFQSNLQYETFIFHVNEKKLGSKHFTKILTIFINDFIGEKGKSFNLGGELVIKEALPLTLSRDAIMVSQDVEPNLFFRDFIPAESATLQTLLQSSLPTYNPDDLNITANAKDIRSLLRDDVSTQIGQKFLATTNNIQKITLLLSVKNREEGMETDLIWNGDIVVSIYPLQSTVNCPTDIAPNLSIDFDPANIPLAQVSFNYNSLQQVGTVLDSVSQPVDFIFSNSAVASGSTILSNNYYAVTIKRSGSANKCDILIAVGNDRVSNSRETIFNGNIWTDVTDEDIWFQIWTDAAKVSDGQGYESGFGIIVPKTNLDTNSSTTTDYVLNHLSFFGTDIFRAVLAANLEKSTPVQDQRTGNSVFSRQQHVPSISLLNTLEVASLENTSDPLLLGAIVDKNRKFFDIATANILTKLHSATIVDNEMIFRIVDDPTDIVRYDTSVLSLVSNLLNGDLTNAKIVPDNGAANTYYRIAKAELVSMITGDVDGDGLITSNDLDLLNSYVGFNMNSSPPLNTIITTAGSTTTFINGYYSHLGPFSNLFTITFQVVDPITNLIVANGSDGVLVAHPTDDRLAEFTSASVSFNTIVGLGNYKLVINTPSNQENCGGFDIISLDSLTDVVTIRKIILNGNSLLEMMRADINGDFYIDNIDGYLLDNYLQRVPLVVSPIATYPAPATNPYNKIGTRFNAIRFVLEEFIDRADDYASLISNRNDIVHPIPDIFLNDGYLNNHDYYTSPIFITISKELSWDETLIVGNSAIKSVPSTFIKDVGFIDPRCDSRQGIHLTTYPISPNYDPGLVDFYVPNNLILGNGGQILRPSGNFYKVDFEMGTIVLEIPDGLYGTEKTINIFNDFVADYTGEAVTRLGFPAMRFADCSPVDQDALIRDQVRFSVAVQSFSPNTNGLDDGNGGVIVDGKIGVSMDYTTGLLTLNFTNLYEDAILPTLNTKIQISVFLKKGGFNNQTLFIDSTKVQNMLKLISVFSGSNVGGPSALIDLGNDVTGILPILHGGTGLNATGPIGTVLSSTGSSLSYQYIADLFGVISFSTGIPDANKVVKTDGYGLLDPSFYYKNPVYIYGVAGLFSNNTGTPTTIGALTFRFDKYILQGVSHIYFESILYNNDNSTRVTLQLFDITNTAVIITIANSTSTPTLVRSVDIKTQMLIGATDFVYDAQLFVIPGGNPGFCSMARLVLEYANPAAQPPTSNSYNFVPFLPPP